MTLLEYVTYSYQDCQWILEQNSRVAVLHGVEYASILSPGKAMCIAARELVGMVYNSSNCVTIHDSPDMTGKLFTGTFAHLAIFALNYKTRVSRSRIRLEG